MIVRIVRLWIDVDNNQTHSLLHHSFLAATVNWYSSQLPDLKHEAWHKWQQSQSTLSYESHCLEVWNINPGTCFIEFHSFSGQWSACAGCDVSIHHNFHMIFGFYLYALSCWTLVTRSHSLFIINCSHSGPSQCFSTWDSDQTNIY